MLYRPFEDLEVSAIDCADVHVFVRCGLQEYLIPLSMVHLSFGKKGVVSGEITANMIVSDGYGDVLRRLYETGEIFNLEIRIGGGDNIAPRSVYSIDGCVMKGCEVCADCNTDGRVTGKYTFRRVSNGLQRRLMKLSQLIR